MLKATGLSFGYGKEDTVANIDFVVKKGEFVCLLGANGSGKTTILKCLNRILKPKSGDVYIDGVRLSQLSQKDVAQQIGMVPQEHSAVFSYQVLDVVAMGVTVHLSFGQQPGIEDYNQAKEALDQLGILNLADRSYNQLSGGERQLVLIARALMQRTDFLVMDEPTSHLDFKNQHLLMLEIEKLTEQGVGVITALHDPNLALKFCDKVVMIKDGRIVAQGETAEVMSDNNLKEIYGIDVVVDELSRKVEVVASEKAS